ncbi:MAG: HutP family protein [Clostridiales bacterium]|nr:HutP family protein [Clostridiales bacterium]
MRETIADSKITASAAIRIALTVNREEETELKNDLLEQDIRAAAADFGGEFISSVSKIIERCIVAAQREGIIAVTHVEEGALAGAAREAISQITSKAIGLNVGGKIGIARYNDHISVCMFFGIGLLHLNEIAVGLGHRAI